MVWHRTMISQMVFWGGEASGYGLDRQRLELWGVFGLIALFGGLDTIVISQRYSKIGDVVLAGK